MNARLLASLTVFNAVVLMLSFAFWLAQPAATAIAQQTLPVLRGRPNVKIAAHERGAGALVAGDSDPTWVQILAEDGYTSVRLTNKDGRVQTLMP